MNPNWLYDFVAYHQQAVMIVRVALLVVGACWVALWLLPFCILRKPLSFCAAVSSYVCRTRHSFVGVGPVKYILLSLLMVPVVVLAMSTSPGFDLKEKSLRLCVDLPDGTGTLARVSKMSRLEDLNLCITPTADESLDLSFLSDQHTLKKLRVECCGTNSLTIKSVAPLASSKLTSLFLLGRVYVKDVSSLGSLSELREFKAPDSADPYMISCLPRSLENLDMSGAQQGIYAGALTNLVNLEVLEQDTIYHRRQYVDGGDIKALPKLRKLVLDVGADEMDFSVLRACRNLESLELSECSFRPLDLSVFRDLPLKELTLRKDLVRSFRGIESVPLESLVVEFCPVASMDAFGVHPTVRTVLLLKTGVTAVSREEVLRHFPNVWRFVYGDVDEFLCEFSMGNTIYEFGPTNVVLSVTGEPRPGCFMGYNLNLPILYENCGAISLCGGIVGPDDYDDDSWLDWTCCGAFEYTAVLGKPYHGFSSMKVCSLKGGDSPAEALVFNRMGDAISSGEMSKWCAALRSELESVYGATFRQQEPGFDLYQGSSKDYLFEIKCVSIIYGDQDKTMYSFFVVRRKGQLPKQETTSSQPTTDTI